MKTHAPNSAISYRLALTRDLPRVATEAGNSPAIVQRHYAGLVKPDAAKKIGGPSEGLCTIDADGDEYLKELLALNPGLRETLTSKGDRGGNIWLRVRGPYPPSGRIKTLQGAGFGEWRADGNQTVIYGRHPSGRDYSNNGKRPLGIEFTEIIWPENVLLPWKERISSAFKVCLSLAYTLGVTILAKECATSGIYSYS